ncbi:MAG: hypothetical protein WA902_02470 [Thermosynechococcaceae cyanobacterium]
MAQEFTTRSRTDQDGSLHVALDVMTELPDADVQIKVIIEPSSPMQAPKARRIPGIDKGQLVIPKDFNAPLPEEIQRAFG